MPVAAAAVARHVARQHRLDRLHRLARPERNAAHAVVADGVDEELGAHELGGAGPGSSRGSARGRSATRLARVPRQRVQVMEVRVRDAAAGVPHLARRGGDRPVRPTPAEDEARACPGRRPRAPGCRRSLPPSARAAGSSGRGCRGRRGRLPSCPPSQAADRSSPGVPGIVYGRASVSASRAYGRKCPSSGGRREARVDGRQPVDVRDEPGLGAVREVGVREQVDGRPVLDRDPRRSSAMSKQLPGVDAASTGIGDSEFRPNRPSRPPAPASSACPWTGRPAGCRGSGAAARA